MLSDRPSEKRVPTESEPRLVLPGSDPRRQGRRFSMVILNRDMRPHTVERLDCARKIGEEVSSACFHEVEVRKETEAGLSETPPPASPRVVLVADNDREILQLLRLILTRNGYEVVSAANGWEAIEAYAAARGQIGVVLLDQNMPVWTGAETAERLGKLDPDVRIVLTSGGVEPDLSPHLQGFVRAFLPKPYNAEQLLHIVREAEK
jgi:CheY-like chemotaxis protein